MWREAGANARATEEAAAATREGTRAWTMETMEEGGAWRGEMPDQGVVTAWRDTRSCWVEVALGHVALAIRREAAQVITSTLSDTRREPATQKRRTEDERETGGARIQS